MNPSRPHLNRCRHLRGWVLGCLLLAWGLAWAAPLLKPPTLNLVCSASGGVSLVAANDDGQPVGSAHQALDCALCLPTSLPPPCPPAVPDIVACGSTIPLPFEPVLVPTASATPPPARGPPVPL
jgi:hypothetical protein